MIWAFIYSNLIGNSIGLNICGMWVIPFPKIDATVAQLKNQYKINWVKIYLVVIV
ncbi:ABC-3 protein [Planktothrix agardhii]|nr:ABC-3 protein [Planktothrix agardhii]